MDTLAFLNLTLPAAPSYFVQLLAFPNGPDGDSKSGGSHKFVSRDQMAAVIAKNVAAGWDVYVSMAGFRGDAKGHYAAFLPESGSHQAHWVDLDCGPGKPYATIKDGLVALNTFLKQHPQIPTPLMVISGNGVHLYWPYDHAVDLAVWRPQAWALRQIMERAGLQIDGKCSIDPVRLLRPPGTSNRKDPSHPKNVYCPFPAQHDFKPISTVAMFAALDAYRVQYQIPVHIEQVAEARGKEQYDSDLSAGLREPYSFGAVAESCRIAKWHALNGGAPLKDGLPGMHNATWMGVAAIYKFSDEGEDLFFEHASQYPGYKKREARTMLNRIDHSGPRCETLANTALERAMCKACGKAGQINSPVTMGTERAVIMLKQATQQMQAAAPVQQSQPIEAPATDLFGNAVATGEAPMFSSATPPSVPLFLLTGLYRHTPKGVCAVTGSFPDGNPILSHPFLSHIVTSAVRLREREGVTQYRFEFMSTDQFTPVRKTVTLTAEQLGKSPGDVNTLLLNNQIVPKNTGKVNHVMGYLHEWVQHSLSGTEDTIATQMGYQDDGSFVLGKSRFKDGKPAEIYLSTQLEEIAPGYRGKGTLDGWQQAARVMCDGATQRNMQSLLGLAIAFGAPLMRFTDQHGALISFCTGESGRGKTTTGNLMSSVWGEPKRLLGSAAGDSEAHIYNHLARANTLPVLLDEATSTDPEKMARLLSMLTNGNAPGRANANGTNRHTHSWRTLGVTNTNHQISGKLSMKRHEGAGEQARLLEFMFDQSVMTSDPAVHEAIRLFTEEHFGTAGPIYAQALTANEDDVRSAVAKRLQVLRDQWQVDPRERVWIAAMAAMITGLALARRLNIINWQVDFAAFCEFLHTHMRAMRNAYQDRHQPILLQMLDVLGIMMQKHGVTVTQATQTAGAARRLDVAESMDMPREIYCRHDVHDGILHVQGSKFSQFAGENGNAMKAEATRLGYMVQAKCTVRLGTGLQELNGRSLEAAGFRLDYRKMLADLMPPSESPATVMALKPAG